MKFGEKWLESVDAKNSVLCAGLDPAEFAMGRGEKGLPQGVDKLDWSIDYVHAVEPYSACVKPNIQYWKSQGDMSSLKVIGVLARDMGLTVIDDSKLADIGSTNDAGLFYSSQRADAVTFSPFAGNLEEAVGQAHARELGLISMVLMSNPEFERVKNQWIAVNPSEYAKEDVHMIDDIPHVRHYIQLAHDAQKFGADAIVIGAPSKGNHIQESEIATVRRYVSGSMKVLLPGVGAQGGEATLIWKYFGSNDVAVNVGREMMFPNGSGSTPGQQKEKAQYFQNMLNELRRAA